MAQENGGEGTDERYSVGEGEFEATGGTGAGEETSKMKCSYCDALNHLESACPVQAGDRRTEVCLGILFFVFMIPFYALTFVVGVLYSAAKAGFEAGDGMWPETWKVVRRNKKDGEPV